jgi:exopolysaccharide biosynthesis protein
MLAWVQGWSWYKKTLMILSLLGFLASSFMFLTPAGTGLRFKLAETVIMTQHRWYAWVLVGGAERDRMVEALWKRITDMGAEPQDFDLVTVAPRVRRTKDELIRVEDIEDKNKNFRGKMMWVYDPTSIRMVVTSKQGWGERITEMVQRTGAVAGVNAGGFDDPDGLGNGFAPIGLIMSDSQVMYQDADGKQPIVGFTGEGKLVVGNYSLEELRGLGVKEAASFYPRVIVDGKPLITSGDGGTGRQPRTAVGQKADGTVIFIVIDGRQPGWSIGATMREVQDLFLEQGVINAGFLDGGASSELVVDGKLLTKPSSRYGERRLPSAFLVFDKPEKIVVTSPWTGLTHIDAGGAATHPEFQEELRRQREQAARNPQPQPQAAQTGGGKGGSVQSATYGGDAKPGTAGGTDPSGGTAAGAGGNNAPGKAPVTGTATPPAGPWATTPPAGPDAATPAAGGAAAAGSAPAGAAPAPSGQPQPAVPADAPKSSF